MVPDMNGTPQRRSSKQGELFPTLGSERSGAGLNHFDLDDDDDGMSSRPGSVYSNYNNMNVTSLNAALAHHLHFEPVSAFNNSRQKKKRGYENSFFGSRAKKSRGSVRGNDNINYGLNTANSDGTFEETEANIAMKELASRQHGTIIRDEATRIQEGAAELQDNSVGQSSERLLGQGDNLDFNQNYKYTPKDNKIP